MTKEFDEFEPPPSFQPEPSRPPSREQSRVRSPSPGRSVHILSVVGLSVAGAVFLSTVRCEQRRDQRMIVSPAPSATVSAPNYSDLRTMRRGPNSLPYPSQMEKLVALAPDASAGALSPTRIKLRAYQGAPPVIPHPIAADSVNDCLACHENGALVLGKIAPKMSHPRREVCTQCHVPDTVRDRVGTANPAPSALATNTFQGLWFEPDGGSL